MALSNANKKYLDEFANPSEVVILVGTLKQVLTDSHIATLKNKVKDFKIAKLESQKADIEAKIDKLNG